MLVGPRVGEARENEGGGERRKKMVNYYVKSANGGHKRRVASDRERMGRPEFKSQLHKLGQ